MTGTGKECDLAYDNQLMVSSGRPWRAGTSGSPSRPVSRRRPAPEPTAWASYLRCHDDIGWAMSDADAAAVGLDGFSHRRFLNDFYAGHFPGSFARGALFQENPVTGDARISGTAASLCGIQAALAAGHQDELNLAIRRLESMYAVAFSFGGIPLIYMGDELAMLNDPHWHEDPAHGADNRWLHRPAMDWAQAARRSDPDSVEGRVFAAIRALIAARQALLALRSGGDTEILPTENRQVLAYRRTHPRSAPFLSITNFSDYPQAVDARLAGRARLHEPRLVHATIGETIRAAGRIELPPWTFAWLTGR